MEFDALRQCPKISHEIYSCCPQRFQIVVSNQQRSANSTCRTFREVSCAAKAAFRVRRHGETRRGRRRFRGGRGNASKPAVESTTPIADRRFSMPPGSWSRVAQLHPQNSLKSPKLSLQVVSVVFKYARMKNAPNAKHDVNAARSGRPGRTRAARRKCRPVGGQRESPRCRRTPPRVSP